MKKFAVVLLMLCAPFVVFGGMNKDQQLDAGYVLKNITIPEFSDRASVVVNTVIDSSPKAVWDALADIDHWPRWLPMTKRAGFLSDEAAKLVTPENAKDREKVMEIKNRYPGNEVNEDWSDHWTRVAYEEYDLPWPIKNEWVVRRYTYDHHKDFSRASWKRIDSKREEDDGSWEVSVWKDGRTHLIYNYKVKPKENVPEVVFKTAVSMTVNSMIKALRHEARRRELNL